MKNKQKKLLSFMGGSFALFGFYILYLSYRDVLAQKVFSRAGEVTATMDGEPIAFWLTISAYAISGLLLIYLGFLLVKDFYTKK